MDTDDMITAEMRKRPSYRYITEEEECNFIKAGDELYNGKEITIKCLKCEQKLVGELNGTGYVIYCPTIGCSKMDVRGI